MNRRFRFSTALNAVLSAWVVVFMTLGGPALAQSNLIPGVGGGVPPKVLIIFDTSTSMRRLPETDLSTNPSVTPIFSEDGGIVRTQDYTNDDFNPASNGSPDGGCANRFCIAKRVLYNTMPTYADSIQMGVAGYYQYRTQWTMPAGSTACYYDVLAGPGKNQTFTDTATGWSTATARPKPNQTICSDIPQNQYTFTQVAVDGGNPVLCRAYRPQAGGGPYSNMGDTNCTATNNFVLDGGVDFFPYGTNATNSNAWVQMARGATCTAGDFYWRATGATTGAFVAAGTLINSKFWNTSTNGGSGATPVMSLYKQTGASFAATNIAPWGSLTNAQTACKTSNGACRITVTTDQTRGADSELNVVWIYADAGTSIDGGTGLTGPFTRDGGSVFVAQMTRPYDAGCTWPDGTTAVNGTDRLLWSTAGFGAVPGGMACTNIAAGSANLSEGCRVRAAGTTSTAAAWTDPTPAAYYSKATPSAYTGTCTATGATTSIPWQNNGPYTVTVPLAYAAASCSGLTVNSTASSTYINSSWSGGPPVCSATQPCDYYDGGLGSVVDSTTYYKALADAGVKTLVSGYPQDAGLIYWPRNGYAEACPTGELNDGRNPTCTASNPCTVNYLGLDSDGGAAPGDQFWFSNSVAQYAVDGGFPGPPNPVYAYSGDVGYVNISTNDYGPLDITGCAANVTLSSGENLTAYGANGVCDAAHPCNLVYDQDYCFSISPPYTAQTCTGGTDGLQTKKCGYKVMKSRYSATPFGSCKYQYSAFKYETKQCSYKVNNWGPNKPGGCFTYTCVYDVNRWPYTYSDPYTYCRAYGTEYSYVGSTTALYTYQWTTRGGEYLGTFSVSGGSVLSSRNWCELPASRYATDYGVNPASSANPTCPPEINASNRALFSGTANSACGVGGSVCRLRWRSNVTVDAGVPDAGFFNRGRYAYTTVTNDTTYTTGATVYCSTPDRDGGEVVTPDVTSWVPQVADGGYSNWCLGTGSAGPPQYRLVADWYETGRPNAAPSATLPYADFWTNQVSKESGWSVNQQDGGTSQIFVPLDLGTNNLSAVKTAFSACVRPTDLTTPMAGGFCTVDYDNCGPGASNVCQTQDAGMTDYTPLNGALKNAQAYLQAQLATDTTDYACRDYYVVLVTDGLESSPANYTQADIQTTVTGLTNTTSTSPARSKTVKTFVIGFGAGLAGAADAGATDLDVIARTGLTAMVQSGGNIVYDMTNGKALSASNETELRNVLNIVFSSITQGRFSRSRPTLTATSDRIYQAFFDRGVSGALDAGTPEWRGNLQAYSIDVAGNLTNVWEFRPKVDNQAATGCGSCSGPARVLKAEIADGGQLTLQDFSTSNATMVSYMNALSSGAGADTIRFVRNDGLGTLSGETFTPIAIPRMTRAGAFVFSNPVVVGPPVFTGTGYAGLSTETGVIAAYNSFKTLWTGRPTRIIIGSEDGFLHGIADKSGAGACSPLESDGLCPNGTEAWGLIPSSILKQLPSTRSGPLLLVDGTTAIADVCWPSVGSNAANCSSSNDWRTIAIGSLRGGGQSVVGCGGGLCPMNDSEYFALDITDGGFPTPLWKYDDRFDDVSPGSDDDLGMTYSTPTIGRVPFNGEKRWVAFAGGGKCVAADEGDGIYMLDAKTGKAELSSTFITKWTDADDCGTANPTNFVARPTLYKRAGRVDVESAYYGSERGQVWAQRIYDTSNDSDWRGKNWYDPWDNMSRRDVFGNTRAPIYYMVKETGGSFVGGTQLDTGCRMELGSGGTPNSLPASAALANCSSLGSRRPIYAAPKVANVTDTSLVSPDLYFGTGDVQALDTTTDRNYFFAVYDNRFASSHDASNGGKTLWVYMFDPGEKVLGQPAFSGGSVVVATYAPPLGGTCNQLGDSYLYAFDPKTGAPRNTLHDPSTPPGTYTSVMKLSGVGAISDLVVVNGGIYYANGKGGIGKTDTKPVGFGGRVQGWRRVR